MIFQSFEKVRVTPGIVVGLDSEQSCSTPDLKISMVGVTPSFGKLATKVGVSAGFGVHARRPPGTNLDILGSTLISARFV